MDRKWIAGLIVAAIVVVALLVFSQGSNQPDPVAADPGLTSPSDPAPRP
ncbi:hypothetical protein [Devosia sp. 1566]|nr:hypothetical protein [Devosia sp. 1566]